MVILNCPPAACCVGWVEQLGRNDAGPYLAFIRGTDYFHVVADSRRVLSDARQPYGADDRTAMTVTIANSVRA